MSFKKSPNPKIASIEFRVTPEEKARIQAEAKVRLLSVSDFALRRMLGKQTPVQFEYIAIAELSNFARDIKQMYRDAGRRPEDAERLGPILDAIVEAIHQLWKQRGRKR
jgi:hypothetical protein